MAITGAKTRSLVLFLGLTLAVATWSAPSGGWRTAAVEPTSVLSLRASDVHAVSGRSAQQSLPDFRFYAPAGWESPLVLSSTTGTTVTGPLFSDQPTYVDVAIANLGLRDATPPFILAILLDSRVGFSLLVPELPALQLIGYEDIEISVPPGTHTIEAVIDPISVARPQGLILEEDETNNGYQISSEWTAAPPSDVLVAGPRVNLGPLAGNGELPLRLGLDREHGRLYATNLSSDLVSVADLSTMTVLDAIDVGRGPEGIGLDLGARRAYVSSSLHGKLSTVDLDSSLVVQETPIGIGASAVVVNDGLVYVHIETRNVIAVVDGTDGSLLELVPFGPEAPDQLVEPQLFSSLALDAASGRLFASVSPPPGGSGTTLAVISLDGGTPVWVDLEGELRDLAFNPENQRLYATLANHQVTGASAALGIYSTDGGLSPIATVPLPVPVGLELAVDPLIGGVFVAAGTAGGVLRLDPDGSELDRFGPDEWSRGLVVDQVGERLFAANASLARVNVFGLAPPDPSPVEKVVIGKRLMGGSFDPTRNRFFAIGSEGETISEIDGNEPSLIETFALDPKIVDLTVHPGTGFGYAIRKGQSVASTTDALLKVDLSLQQVVNSVALPGAPRLVGLDTSRDRVYVALAGTSPLLVFEADTLAPAPSLPVLLEPRDMAVNSITGDIFVVEPVQQRLRRIDPDSGDTIEALGIPGTAETEVSSLALDQERGIVYVSGNWEELTVQAFEAATLQLLPIGFDVSVIPPMGDLAENRKITGLVVNEQDNVIYISLWGNVVFHPPDLLAFSGEDGALVGRLSAGNVPVRPAFDDNLGRIYLTNAYSGDVSIFDVPGYAAGAPTLPPPSGFEAHAGDGKVILQWDPLVDAAGFRIARCLAGRPPLVSIHPALLPGSATRYADSAVNNGQAYEYAVRAVNVAGVDGPPAYLVSPAVPERATGEAGFKLTSLRISARARPSWPARFTLEVPFATGLRQPIELSAESVLPFAHVTFDPPRLRGPGTVLMEVTPLDATGVLLTLPFEVSARSGEIHEFLNLFLDVVPEGDPLTDFGIPIEAPPITVVSDSELAEEVSDRVAIKGRVAAEVDFSALNIRAEKADGSVELATGVVAQGGVFAHNFSVEDASQMGLWHVSVSWEGGSRFVGASVPTFTLPVGVGFPGGMKARSTFTSSIQGIGETVIVGSRPGYLADQIIINALSNMVYDTLRARRFTDETLAVLSNSSFASGYDAPSTIASLASAVAAAAGSNPLALYLVGDTNSPGQFPLNPTETLTAAQLRGMLDPYVSTQTQVIVIDCPYAASFIDLLAGPNRAVIASTGRTGPATLIPPSSSFTRFFLDVLESEGATLGVALSQAGSILRLRDGTFGSQIPEGSFNPGDLANLTLGSLFNPAPEPIPDKIPPQIVEVAGSSVETMGTPVVVWAKVEDDTDAPGDVAVHTLMQREGGGESHILPLVYSATNERYQALIPSGTPPGHYGITYQAIDSSDNSSGLVVSSVVLLPDVDEDEGVSALDLYRLMTEFHEDPPAFDFTDDGSFNYLDLFQFAVHWGETK
jgi:YVTN family beta-propeller protein